MIDQEICPWWSFIKVKGELRLAQLHIGKDIELISGNIQLDKKKVVLCNFYRPPNKQKAGYTEKTLDDSNTCTVNSKHKNGIFLSGGDFNLPDINWKSNCITVLQVPINQAFLTDDCKPFHSDRSMCIQLEGEYRRCKTLPPLGNSDHAILIVTFPGTYTERDPA